MDTVAYVLMAVIATIAAFGIGQVIIKNRKAGGKSIPWNEIRPIITNVILQMQEVHQMKKMGYQALEDYGVLLVRAQLLKANFLTQEEKALITDDVIRSLIGPRLKAIYLEKK